MQVIITSWKDLMLCPVLFVEVEPLDVRTCWRSGAGVGEHLASVSFACPRSDNGLVVKHNRSPLCHVQCRTWWESSRTFKGAETRG